MPHMLRVLHGGLSLMAIPALRPNPPRLHFHLQVRHETAAVCRAPPLRPYQEECIAAVLKNIKLGHRRLAISLATGGGKTIIFTRLIELVQHHSRPRHATRTLILAHRVELVLQAFNHARAQYPNATIDIEMGSRYVATGTADITVASVNSIARRGRLPKYDSSTFKQILIDEAHHAVSNSYLRTLEYFGVLDVEERGGEMKPVVIGVSATMSRSDGLALTTVLDRVVFHKDSVDLMKLGWLCPVKFATVHTTADLTQVGSGGMPDETNKFIVSSWISLAQNRRRSTIVFAVSIAHADGITEMFRSHGVDARLITSKTSPDDRKARLHDFKEGKYPVLVNKGIFTEGSDIPNIDCVLLTRPINNSNLLVQMIGRGLRLHPGKRDCLVISICGRVEAGIAPTPALFGLGPDLHADTKHDTSLPPGWRSGRSHSHPVRYLPVGCDGFVAISPNSATPRCFDVAFVGSHQSKPSYSIAKGVKTAKTAVKLADGYIRARTMFPGAIPPGGYRWIPADLIKYHRAGGHAKANRKRGDGLDDNKRDPLERQATQV